MELNTNIIEIERRRRGLKKSELADKMGVTRQGLHHIIKTRKTTWDRLTQLASVLNLNPKDLLV